MTKEDNDLRIKQFLRHAHSSSLEEFIECYPSPVLVVKSGLCESDEGFLTQLAEPVEDFEKMKTATRFDPNARVFQIEKRPGSNPYSKMVILGRAPNSDIVLQSSEVSKMHAYFIWADSPEGKTYKVVDGNSSNGTWFAGTRLPPYKPCHLKNGDFLGFGSSILTRFFYPTDFFLALLRASVTSGSPIAR
ncbi:MAG: FHA domain-containing protein [Myxococcota bacterium]|jgi:hypothetical protein|nr:FHA domain-containing protein [Myxococcota bacterium]